MVPFVQVRPTDVPPPGTAGNIQIEQNTLPPDVEHSAMSWDAAAYADPLYVGADAEMVAPLS